MARNKLKQNSVGRSLDKNDPKRVARGQDMYGYGEQKQRCNLTLTPTAIAILDRVAKANGLSKSEYLERWLRNEVSDSLDTSELDK